jgi:hypothetical protein
MLPNVNFALVYDCLSLCDNNNYYTGIIDMNLLLQSEFYIQGGNGNTDLKKFPKGCYIKWNNVKNKRTSNERMILNTSNQGVSEQLALHMKRDHYQFFESIKFLAKESDSNDNNPVKCDKIVIYYEKENRDNILKAISNYVNENNIKLSSELSAFYDVYYDSSIQAYVGIAEEKDRNNSFTVLNSKCIIKAINKGLKTSKEIFDNWLKEHEVQVVI